MVTVLWVAMIVFMGWFGVIGIVYQNLRQLTSIITSERPKCSQRPQRPSFGSCSTVIKGVNPARKKQKETHKNIFALSLGPGVPSAPRCLRRACQLVGSDLLFRQCYPDSPVHLQWQ